MLTITAFCWACNAVFARLAVGEVSPLLLVALRWTGVTVLLLFIAWRPIQNDWEKLKPHLPLLFLMGSLGFATFNALFYISAYTTTALNIGIIQGSIPVFVLLGAFLMYRTRVSPLQCMGVVLTIVGVGIIASAGSLQRLATLTVNQGDYLMILACLLYSGYAVCLRKVTSVSTLSIFSVVAVAAAIAALPMSWVEYSRGELLWPSTKGWVIVALVTVFPSFIAQLCFIKGVATIGPGRAGIFVNMVPVYAAVLAVLILDEPFRFFHAAALILVIAGIGLAEKGKFRTDIIR